MCAVQHVGRVVERVYNADGLTIACQVRYRTTAFRHPFLFSFFCQYLRVNRSYRTVSRCARPCRMCTSISPRGVYRVIASPGPETIRFSTNLRSRWDAPAGPRCGFRFVPWPWIARASEGRCKRDARVEDARSHGRRSKLVGGLFQNTRSQDDGNSVRYSSPAVMCVYTHS